MVTSLMGEFVGTLFLVFLGSGVVANTLLSRSKGENAGWFTIVTGWGIAVMIAVFIAQSAGSIQADINPAVTLAKYLLSVYDSFSDAALIMLVQLLGAFCGAVLTWIMYLPHWRLTAESDKKLAVFATSPAIQHPFYNFLSEAMGTIVLIVGIWAIFGESTMGNPATGFGPYLVGFLVWGIGLSLGGPTGYAINPARDLGPRLAHALLPIAGKGDSGWGYAWIPVLAPFLGAIIGAFLVAFIF